MKKIIVLSLLAVMLTGCVKQADYDNLESENSQLQKKISKLEDEVNDLEDEIQRLKEENKLLHNSTTTQSNTTQEFTSETQTDSDELFTKLYTDDTTNEMIGVSIALNDDNEKYIVLSYIPSDTDAEYPLLYEMKCYSFIGFSSDLVSPLNGNYALSITPINEKYRYCKTDIYNQNNNLVMTSYNRDGTYCSASNFDATMGNSDFSDWIHDIFDSETGLVETTSVLWINDTFKQIKKDIEGIYP